MGQATGTVGRWPISTLHTIQGYRQALEEELKECFAGREGFLYHILRYQLGWVDQQGQPADPAPRESFHALFAPAACDALTGEIGPSIPIAAGVELLNAFCQVHGEVQAGKIGDSSRPSIWWAWGPAQAINAGDGFHALARVAVSRLLQGGIAPGVVLSAAGMLDRACLAICEGQYTDLGFQDRMLVTITEYDDMIARKSGALSGCAAAASALVAGGDENTQARFEESAVQLGMAWQITRDVADFWGASGDGVTASNVLNKKKSLPLIYTLDNCPISGRREIGAAYMKRVLEPEDISRIVEIMEEVGARTFCEERASDLVQQALGALDELNIPSERRAGFRQLGELALQSEVRAV